LFRFAFVRTFITIKNHKDMNPGTIHDREIITTTYDWQLLVDCMPADAVHEIRDKKK
jgi:hypothetical protein